MDNRYYCKYFVRIALELCSHFELRVRSWCDGNHSSSFCRIMVSLVRSERLYLGRNPQISLWPVRVWWTRDARSCRYGMPSITLYDPLLVSAPVHRILLLGELTLTRRTSGVDILLSGEWSWLIARVYDVGDRGSRGQRYDQFHHSGTLSGVLVWYAGVLVLWVIWIWSSAQERKTMASMRRCRRRWWE